MMLTGLINAPSTAVIPLPLSLKSSQKTATTRAPSILTPALMSCFVTIAARRRRIRKQLVLASPLLRLMPSLLHYFTSISR